MSRSRDWGKAPRHRRTQEQAVPTGGGPIAGAWTHIKREPVRTFSREEIDSFLADRERP